MQSRAWREALATIPDGVTEVDAAAPAADVDDLLALSHSSDADCEAHEVATIPLRRSQLPPTGPAMRCRPAPALASEPRDPPDVAGAPPVERRASPLATVAAILAVLGAFAATFAWAYRPRPGDRTQAPAAPTATESPRAPAVASPPPAGSHAAALRPAAQGRATRAVVGAAAPRPVAQPTNLPAVSAAPAAPRPVGGAEDAEVARGVADHAREELEAALR